MAKRKSPTAKSYAESVLSEDTRMMDLHGNAGVMGTGGFGLLMGGIPMAQMAEARMNKARADIAAIKPKIDAAKAVNAKKRKR